jgi:trimethylamine-N-oxide reductase cytochrome c-type subunit TorC
MIVKWIKEHRVLFAVLVIAFLGVSFAGMELTMQPFFCNSCHVMGRVYSSWKESPHKAIGCMECHAAPGLVGLVKAKVAAMKSPYYQFTASPEKVKELLKHHTETPDAACLKCHKNILEVDRAGSIMALHKKHYTMPGADCQNCHENVGHLGALPENDVTFHMGLCLACHAKQQGGKAPLADSCDRCHVGESEMLAGKGGMEVDESPSLMPDLACTDCHSDQGDFKPKAETCVECHDGDESYKDYIKEWQDQVKPAFQTAKAKYEAARTLGEKLNGKPELLKAFQVGEKNYKLVLADRSRGAHNPDYAVALLEKATAKLDQALQGAK